MVILSVCTNYQFSSSFLSENYDKVISYSIDKGVMFSFDKYSSKVSISLKRTDPKKPNL